VSISPHNAMGPLQVLTVAHAVLTVSSLYRLERNVAGYGIVLFGPLH
jgi:hypothetical protein